MARNTKGQITSKNTLTRKISKTLQNVADETAIRIRPLIRDELERTLRLEIYNSYGPATKSGRETQEYNATHKHQKPKSYHHTGTLIRSIHGYIDGDIVGAKPREDYKYEDGTTAQEVYDYLKFGTPKQSSKKGFFYDNGQSFSPYMSQEPHNFEARTREHMDQYEKELLENLKSESWRKANGIDIKYKNKRV